MADSYNALSPLVDVVKDNFVDPNQAYADLNSATMEPPAPLQVQQPAGLTPDYLTNGQMGGASDVEATIQALQSKIKPQQIEQPELVREPAGAPPQANVPQPMPAQKALPDAGEQYLKEMQGLTKQQKDAYNSIAGAAQGKAQFEMQAQEMLAEEAKGYELKQLGQRCQRAEAIKVETKKIADVQQEFKNSLGREIDPNKYWEDRSSGQRVLAGIAIMLGGYAGGLSGRGGNQAMDIIQKNIDRDID